MGIWYFGHTINSNYYSTANHPQGVFEKAVFYESTPTDFGSVRWVGSYHEDIMMLTHAAAGRIAQTMPVTGTEGDTIIQGAVDTTGLIVGVAGSARLQALDGYTPTGQRLVNFYSGGGMARDTGTVAENAYGIYIEDPQGNSLGTIKNRRGVWTKAPIHTEDGSWFGTLLSNTHLTATASTGATTITVTGGTVDTNYQQVGTQMIIGGIGGYQSEIVVVDSWNTGAGTITFHPALVNNHSIGESVWSVRAGNLRWSRTDFGLKTDMTFIANNVKTGQIALTQAGGAGYLELPRQGANPPAPGTANYMRLYADTNTPPRLAFMPTGGTKQVVASGPGLPLSAISSPSLTSPNSNETALKSAVDSIRSALTTAGITA